MGCAVVLLARLTAGLCTALLLTAAMFDAQAGRVTSGTMPAEDRERPSALLFRLRRQAQPSTLEA
jgi:hypothetical protein